MTDQALWVPNCVKPEVQVQSEMACSKVFCTDWLMQVSYHWLHIQPIAKQVTISEHPLIMTVMLQWFFPSNGWSSGALYRWLRISLQSSKWMILPNGAVLPCSGLCGPVQPLCGLLESGGYCRSTNRNLWLAMSIRWRSEWELWGLNSKRQRNYVFTVSEYRAEKSIHVKSFINAQTRHKERNTLHT